MSRSVFHTLLLFSTFVPIASSCATMTPRERERAAVRKETSAEELLRRGTASAAIGDMTRAEQYLVAALKAGADERVVVRRLLVVCVSNRHYPVALEYADQYLRRHPTDIDISFAAASIYAASGERARARRMLERVVRERPEWADAHYALATVIREDGADPALADQHDLLYLKLSPNGPMAEVARSRLRRETQ